MLPQTVDQLIPFLNMIQQPAFCIRHDGAIVCNRAASNVAPASVQALPEWLGDSEGLYTQWDRQSGLELSLKLCDVPTSLTVQALEDGLLFLLSSSRLDAPDHAALSVSAQVARQPLSELSILSQQVFDELEKTGNTALKKKTAAMYRCIYQLTRMYGNQSDLDRMLRGQYTLHSSLLDLREFLASLEQELTPLFRDTGKTLEIIPLKNMVQIYANRDLLERLVLNLLSNAMKFGSCETPVTLWVEVRDSSVLLRVRNHCTAADSDLLSAAFNRLEMRGVIPSPNWGIGLGLPIVRQIAQLHGGTTALEATEDGFVTVTASLTRRRPKRDLTVKTPIIWNRTGGMRPSLVELSDVLPSSVYGSFSL